MAQAARHRRDISAYRLCDPTQFCQPSQGECCLAGERSGTGVAAHWWQTLFMGDTAWRAAGQRNNKQKP